MRTHDLDVALSDWLAADAQAPAPAGLLGLVTDATVRRRPRHGWVAHLRGHWVGGDTSPARHDDVQARLRPSLTVVGRTVSPSDHHPTRIGGRSRWASRRERPTTWMLLLLIAATLILGLALFVGGSRIEMSPVPAEFLWSAQGGEDGMYFAGSNGGTLAIDPVGRVWVTDSSHDRFAIFDSTGSFQSYWGTSGTGDGQFHLRSAISDARSDIAFAADGSFYVLDAGNLRVQHFAADRTFLGSWGGHGTDGGQYREPIAIAVDAQGTVHVLDALRGVVESYDPDGTVLGSFRTGQPNSATALAVDTLGDLYVGVCCTTPNGVLKFDPNGLLLASYPSPAQSSQDHPASLAVDAAGTLFVTHGPVMSGDKIEAIDRDGILLGAFGGPGRAGGQFGYGFPQVALDGRGAIYATDGAANRLEKFRLRPSLIP